MGVVLGLDPIEMAGGIPYSSLALATTYFNAGYDGEAFKLFDDCLPLAQIAEVAAFTTYNDTLFNSLLSFGICAHEAGFVGPAYFALSCAVKLGEGEEGGDHPPATKKLQALLYLAKGDVDAGHEGNLPGICENAASVELKNDDFAALVNLTVLISMQYRFQERDTAKAIKLLESNLANIIQAGTGIDTIHCAPLKLELADALSNLLASPKLSPEGRSALGSMRLTLLRTAADVYLADYKKGNLRSALYLSRCWVEIGKALLDAGQYEEAAEELDWGCSGLNERLGLAHVDTAEAHRLRGDARRDLPVASRSATWADDVTSLYFKALKGAVESAGSSKDLPGLHSLISTRPGKPELGAILLEIPALNKDGLFKHLSLIYSIANSWKGFEATLASMPGEQTIKNDYRFKALACLRLLVAPKSPPTP